MKTKTLLPAIVLLLASLASCNSSTPKSLKTNDGSVSIIENPDGPLYICDLKAASDTIDIPLSELIEDCRIVRFETSDEAMFNAWWINVSDNYICIRQESNVVKLYDKDGKYLCDVGAMGNGPGEYSMTVYDEIIDEKGGHIFFSPFYGKKIMMYGLDGKWIKDIDLPGQINKPKIEINADGTLSVVHMPFEEGAPIAFRMDTDGKILSQVPARDYMLAGNFDGEIFSYRNTGTFDFFYTGIDTTFTYDAVANKLVPRFTMNSRGLPKSLSIFTRNCLTISSPTTTLGTKADSYPEEIYWLTRRKCRLPNTAWSTTSTGISRFPIRTCVSTRADSFSMSNRVHFRI